MLSATIKRTLKNSSVVKQFLEAEGINQQEYEEIFEFHLEKLQSTGETNTNIIKKIIFCFSVQVLILDHPELQLFFCLAPYFSLDSIDQQFLMALIGTDLGTIGKLAEYGLTAPPEGNDLIDIRAI